MGDGLAKEKLPAWSWVLPALIFHLGTGLSLNFQVTPGMSLWYFPIPLGIILVHWWGPRVLVGLYLNALLSAGYWGLYRWWLWPLYALPETLKVALSWWLFTRLARGKCWLPDLRNTAQFLLLGIALPVFLGTCFSRIQLDMLGDAAPMRFWKEVFSETVLDILSPFAVTVPILLFGTAFMERHGLTVTSGAEPRAPLLIPGLMTPALRFEAACLLGALSLFAAVLPIEKGWVLLGILLIWLALRFGIGLAAVGGVWTIAATLFLPALAREHFSAQWLKHEDMVRVNMNLALLSFTALVVGRALSDARQETAQRMRADEGRRESEEKYRTLFDSASDAIILSDGRILECNQRCCEMFGWTREELLGNSVLKLFAELQPGGRAAETIPRTREKVLAGSPTIVELKAVRHDGSHFDAESSLRAVNYQGRKVLFGVIRDVTERKLVEHALQESEERFRQMADNIQEIFFLMDRATATMLYISPVAERILGVPLTQLRARPLSLIERMNREDRERIGVEKEGRLQFGSVKGDYRFTRPDGKVIWLRLTSVLVNDQNGEAYRTAGVIADITEYMESQETVRQRQLQLMQSDKLSSLGMMVSGVAHEINNPNNLIMLNGDVLETFWKHLKPALREHSAADPSWRVSGLAYDNAEGKIETLLSGIGGGARRIKRIVDNLKDFARMDHGGMTESIAMEKVIDASVSIVENLIKKSTDRFSITHEDGLPKVRGNFQKLEQVVINLITNACQAVENRTKAIAITTRTDSGDVVLIVRDEGVGIPKEMIGKVADPFFTTKRDHGGTGLGLSVSYGIVQEHRGRMEFRSEVGKGTEIEVRIPAEAGKA